MTSHVDNAVAARIAAAREKRQQRRQQRAELDAARIPGLAARHDAKMRRWAQEEDAAMGQSPTPGANRRDTPTVASVDLTDADLRGAADHAGVTETVTVAADNPSAATDCQPDSLSGSAVAQKATVAASRVDIDTVDDGGDE
ncbi:hypothetical protein [Streptomyces europaeiscabiei]|uniref:hypothetical protein n=1 Tax=Streptomyces europaeiscabiei TaxID=146819 RepID=UPI0029B45C8C|nr:hypothetical protein [Streptomyces europaeiscabiei]MDX2770641.1 hypothetical protein [Streptomyces europaeiscabiei]